MNESEIGDRVNEAAIQLVKDEGVNAELIALDRVADAVSLADDQGVKFWRSVFLRVRNFHR